MPSGPHVVIKLSDGGFCAVPIDLSEKELDCISRLDSATLLEHRSETAEELVYEVRTNYHNKDQLEDTNQPSSSDDEEEARPMEEEPGTSQLQSSENGESHFYGLPERSKYRQHTVLVHKISGRQTCYAFSLHKRHQNSKIYRCIGCKKAGKFTGIVHDLEFASNPCGLRHTCIPTKWTNGISQRTFYEKCQEWRGDPKYATHDQYKEYGNLFYETERSERLAERDKEATLVNFSDYERCRVTIRRNLRQHLKSAVTMEHIPDYLSTNADGSRFLQFQTDDMHNYLSEKVIRL
ncbi:unnamed protein product [Heligmosomoides polygyrus]|uniref:FLYWCH-type domain-containing protein n=1 Tax=Heligmosomoides polygyrus TaxID=6339 RepID=A0A183GBH0_HELPZ|nr:unnamed protein product [Heligmosomoides polygyrus]